MSTSTNQLYIGQMSGTSLDGVDTVLVNVDGSGHCELVAHHHLGFEDHIKTAALALCAPGDNEIHRSRLLARDLSTIYAKGVRGVLAQTDLEPADIAALGCHGQTIRHMPPHYSVQLVDAAALAELTEIRVITDFRSRDLAAGGQGAPLVPAFHQAMFADKNKNRIIANIGGMANITVMKKGEIVGGYDTGPGNVLMDAWYQRTHGDDFDRDGLWAASGKVDENLLHHFLTEPYFHQPPPKSTGRELFNLPWLEQQLSSNVPGANVQATLLALTTKTIAQEAQRWKEKSLNNELVVCGGGADNSQLMKSLTAALPEWRVLRSDALGIHPQWVEAMAFAWLAYQCHRERVGNVPEVTGAQGYRILGAIYPA